MPRPEAKSLRRPEQVRRFPNGRIETVSHHETTIGRFSFEPGWRWSRDVGPIAQTHSCQIHHLGVVLRGRLRIETDAGEVCEFEVDDVYDIPPGHDATVVGDETFEAIEFASARIYATPSDGDRVLAAVLCTDIVDSTSHLRRLGDSAWRIAHGAQPADARGVKPVSWARDPDNRRWLPCDIRRPCSGSSMRAGNRIVSRQPWYRHPSRNSHRRGRISRQRRSRRCCPRSRTRRGCRDGR